MQIQEIISTIKAQIAFRRTIIGRPINKKALEVLKAAIQDDKNSDSEAIKCQNCCIIQSSLLVPEGCQNCGSKDLTTNINKTDVL
jgi:hypothetical protein